MKSKELDRLIDAKSFGADYGFVENKGQIRYCDGTKADDILYMFSANGFKIYIRKNSISYEVHRLKDFDASGKNVSSKSDGFNFLNSSFEFDGKFVDNNLIVSHRVDIDFINSNVNTEVVAEEASKEYYNYYVGGDVVLFVRKYKRVLIKNLYPNIDLVFYLDAKSVKGNRVKYDFIIHKGGNKEDIGLYYKGTSGLKVTMGGELIIGTLLGSLKESIPLAYFEGNTTKRSTAGIEAVECAYSFVEIPDEGSNGINEEGLRNYELRFDVADKEGEGKLVIDPELYWGTYFGGDQYDYFTNVAVDSRDYIYAVGYTQSTTRIATTGAHQTTYSDNTDGCLAKFNNQGRLEWATYYGSDDADFLYSVIVNWQDDVLIGGVTSSTTGIATGGSYQSSYGGGAADGFIVKFNSSGVRQWGSYFGGEGIDLLFGMAMDSSRNLFVGGRTQSQTGIATANGLQSYKEGVVDGYVVKFDSSMQRVWGTYFGGPESSGQESVNALAADRMGNVFVAGYTPCTYSIANDKGHQQDYGGGNYDAFIAKIYPNGQLHWSSYYGGSDEDFARSIATYGNGNVYFLGITKSYNNISTTGAHQQTFAGTRDLFLVKFDTYGERKWGTYYGGSNDDCGIAVAKCGFDEVVFLGYTISGSGIATQGEIQSNIAGKEDIFAVRMTTNGVRRWGTYYGGTDTELFDYGGITTDKKGNIVIASTTQSGSGISTPATSPHQATFVGGELWGQNPDTGEWILYGYRNDAFMIMFGTRITLGNFENEYCQGSTISVPFDVGLDFNGTNTFMLQLSDKDGSFVSPKLLGILNSNTSGFIHGTIPLNTEEGTGYRVRIYADAPSYTSADNGFDITVNSLPVPQIIGSSGVCSRNEYVYQSGTGEGYSYLWKVNNGTIIGDSTLSVVNVKWNDAVKGKVKLVLTNQATSCTDSTEKDIDIVISPQPYITGEIDVISYSEYVYSTGSQSILNYEWEVTGGTIEGTSNTNRITVKWGGPGVGTVRLKLTDTRTDCSDTALINVTINSSPLVIMGQKKTCALSLERYSVLTPPQSKNVWSVTGGQLQGSDKDSVIYVLWGDGAEGFVQLIQMDTVSLEMDTVVLRVELLALPDVQFYGIDEFCEGMSALYIAVTSEGRTNKWVVYNGEIIGEDTGDSVYVKWNNLPEGNDSLVVKGSISLQQTNVVTGCSNQKTKPTYLSKNPLAEFVGPPVACSGRVEIYKVRDKKTLQNKWTVSGGTIIGSAEDTVCQIEWGAPGKGMIKLFQLAQSYCSDSSETEIMIFPVPDKPEILQSGRDLVSSSNSGNQWFINGEEIEGAVENVYTPKETGYYTVQVTSVDGCVSDMSQPFYFEISSVSMGLKELGVRVYPNPTENYIMIDLPIGLFDWFSLRLFNSLGIDYYRNEFKYGDNIRIGLESLPAGIYVLEIRAFGRSYFEKIVKQ